MCECDAVSEMARHNKRFEALANDALARTYVGTLGYISSPVRLMTEAFLTRLIGTRLDNATLAISRENCMKEPDDQV